MHNKVVSLIISALILTGMLSFAFDIRPVEAVGLSPIYILANGDVSPSSAPIQRNGNYYTLTGNITSNADGIIIQESNVTIDGAGHTFSGSGIFAGGLGFNLTGINLVTIKNTTITNFPHAIRLYSSYGSTVSGNSITANIWDGILLLDSSNNTISGNNITTNDGYGIQLSDSSNNTISGNNVANNWYGIQLSDSSSNVLRENVMIDNMYNFAVVGEGVSDFTNDVDSSNTVDSKPIYYWNNMRDVSVPLDAGFVALINCANITVQNLNLTNNGQGILLAQTTNSKITQNSATANDQEGIWLFESSNNISAKNNITDTKDGIHLYNSSYNTISGNKITNTNDGILLEESLHNSILGNRIIGIGRSDSVGIGFFDSDFNSIHKNEITNNSGRGIELDDSNNNSIYGNSIANNGIGIWLGLFETSTNNAIYHNNFVNNTEQAGFAEFYEYGQRVTAFNAWDDGYPSGGNRWSDYNGTDLNGGSYQNETGSDEIGDNPYVIDVENRDNYPLMDLWTPPEHELVASLAAPTFMRIGDSTSLEAIVTNEGSNDEVGVRVELLVNGTVVGSTTIPTLEPYFPQVSNLWTPSIEGTYNVTAFVNPASGETFTENNKVTEVITVGPTLKVGVKAGDWIKYDCTITGTPSGTPLPTWIKVEFLSVEGTTAITHVVMHMSDGTEQNQTMTVDIVSGSGTVGTFSGFLIPANSATGYPVYMSGYGSLTLSGETTRTYAGSSRTAVSTSFSQYGTQLTYYWDNETGVMVEASATIGGMTITAKATETNTWEAAPSSFPIEPIYLIILAALAIIIAVGAVAFIVHRKKKPPEEAKSPQI